MVFPPNYHHLLNRISFTIKKPSPITQSILEMILRDLRRYFTCVHLGHTYLQGLHLVKIQWEEVLLLTTLNNICLHESHLHDVRAKESVPHHRMRDQQHSTRAE